MRVLVTGGAGFIGSNLALKLQDEHEIIVLDDFSSGTKENLGGFDGEVINADIASFDFGTLDADVVLHNAAITDTTLDDREKMMRTNYASFEALLNFCAGRNADLIYASSASVYGNGKTPMKEDQKPEPKNAYAESKLLMEKLARRFENKLKVIGLRYFNVYGPRERHKGKSASMILQLHEQLAKSGKPRIFRHGEQSRDFVFVDDVVEANVLAMKSKKSGVFNVGSGTATSFNEIIEILKETLGIECQTEYFDNPYAFYQNDTLADLESVKSALGYRPSYDIRKGVRKYAGYLGGR